MVQNIKVDVIYYSTPTDFEMEFNLCGCCRMRLLTDKAETRKDLIRSLSRAVSRSRVIICCGALFGEQGLIANIASAIGKPLVIANNSDFGISTTEEIEIIEGSMPLVCADGTFGGCVIESGPQSIVMLSESKSVRKGLLTTLIHPYIEELSRTPEYFEEFPENPAEETVEETVEEVAEEPIEEAAEEIAEDTQEAAEEPLEEIADGAEETAEPVDDEVPTFEPQVQTELDLVLSVDEEESSLEVPTFEAEPMQNTTPGSINDIIFDTSSDDAEFEGTTNDTYDLFAITNEDDTDETDEDFVVPMDSNDSFIFEPSKPLRIPFKLPIIIISAIVIICALALVYLLIVAPLMSGQNIGDYLKNIFSPAVINLVSLR